MKGGIPEDKIESYLREFDRLANLQLIEGIPNMEKSNSDFEQWLSKSYPKRQGRLDYMEKHYIPDLDLGLEHFDQFIVERKKLMTGKFAAVLKL